MNEAEERRRELLKRTKRLYDDSSSVPAVHPRYRHIYRDLYGAEEREGIQSSFFFRCTLGVLCFLCYVWVDYGELNVADVTSERIVNQIEKQFDIKAVKEVWKKL